MRKKTGEILNVSKSRVHNIISKYKKANFVFENKPRSWRPRYFTERKERWLFRNINCIAKTRVVKLTDKAYQRFNMSLNTETDRNVLWKYNFHGWVA